MENHSGVSFAGSELCFTLRSSVKYGLRGRFSFREPCRDLVRVLRLHIEKEASLFFKSLRSGSFRETRCILVVLRQFLTFRAGMNFDWISTLKKTVAYFSAFQSQSKKSLVAVTPYDF